MVKSLLSGGIFGGVIAVVGAGVISVVAPPPQNTDVIDVPMVTITSVPSEQNDETLDVVVSDVVDDAGEVTSTPKVTTPDVDENEEVADTVPLAQPESSAVTSELTVPSEDNGPDVTANDEDQILPNPQSLAPQAPIAEDAFDVGSAVSEPLNVVKEPNVMPSTDETLEIPVEESVAEAPDLAEEAMQEDLVAPNEVKDDEPIVVAIIGDDEARTLPGANSGVKVNRSLGAQPEEEVAPALASEINSDAPAIERYAAQFVGDSGKPAMSVILLHTEGQSNGPAMVSALTFPVTVVIDTSAADAQEMLAAYRDVGAEVALSTTFPRRATPTDVEVAMAAALGMLPETVALVDVGDGGLQLDRNVTRQAVAALAANGRGLVTISKGLNSAIREADAAGVPAGVIYRDLDGDGQDARVIGRFLDQAAFRARQDDGVILLARVRTETMDALSAWGTANRAGQVALAPLSRILTAN